MAIPYYIGIAISKATLDWAIFDGKTLTLQTTTPNTVTGIKTALRQLKILADWNPKQVVFCMEHTAPAARWHLQRPSAGISPQSSSAHLPGRWCG